MISFLAKVLSIIVLVAKRKERGIKNMVGLIIPRKGFEEL